MQQILSLLGAKDIVADMLANLGGTYPILAPIAAGIGVDPIHFAMVFLAGDAIGFITPPYGLNLYAASGITGIPYFRLLHFAVPYLLALLVAWFIIALVPELSTIPLVHEGAGVYQ